MKTRNGWVSNSSSCSFLVFGDVVTDMKELRSMDKAVFIFTECCDGPSVEEYGIDLDGYSADSKKLVFDFIRSYDEIPDNLIVLKNYTLFNTDCANLRKPLLVPGNAIGKSVFYGTSDINFPKDENDLTRFYGMPKKEKPKPG